MHTALDKKDLLKQWFCLSLDLLVKRKGECLLVLQNRTVRQKNQRFFPLTIQPYNCQKVRSIF
ncbi:hypothetical protein Barb6XT_03024 [Bacteroidales bacterium Barb6XT]|nr:hypothetical protein Barb6XT_03024 [Bacteroidales bacterium Barb6XT]